ncbi:hypothetical protein [Streptomyces spectabilis]|uniref:Uncharacterized protein n=1 Tax=Streptomyces spectabilis TaxID=68270 RepID=A0A7W8B3I8_STRST|nr:hypothetical protein [Streptomyces spectabilis]MBB5109681.1 hypothetical protein [Streptomyces spectabilis]
MDYSTALPATSVFKGTYQYEGGPERVTLTATFPSIDTIQWQVTTDDGDLHAPTIAQSMHIVGNGQVGNLWTGIPNYPSGDEEMVQATNTACGTTLPTTSTVTSFEIKLSNSPKIIMQRQYDVVL